MNANKRKHNAAFLLIAPLLCGAGLSASQAHAGTITLSDFAPQRMQHVLLKNEALMFSGRIGSVAATCGGSDMQVSQVMPLGELTPLLVRECPNRGLSVTFTSHRPTPAQVKAWERAAILKHP
jgi:hypothetical protein